MVPFISVNSDPGDIHEAAEVTNTDKRGSKELEYELSIHTGSHQHAGTDGRVLVNIIGNSGDTGFRKIGKTRTIGKKFVQNQVETFKIRAIDIGRIQHVAVEFSGKSRVSKNVHDNKWQIFLITVSFERNAQRSSYIFHVNKWIGGDTKQKTVSRKYGICISSSFSVLRP